jgi:hypothetical protein
MEDGRLYVKHSAVQHLFRRQAQGILDSGIDADKTRVSDI